MHRGLCVHLSSPVPLRTAQMKAAQPNHNSAYSRFVAAQEQKSLGYVVLGPLWERTALVAQVRGWGEPIGSEAFAIPLPLQSLAFGPSGSANPPIAARV